MLDDGRVGGVDLPSWSVVVRMKETQYGAGSERLEFALRRRDAISLSRDDNLGACTRCAFVGQTSSSQGGRSICPFDNGRWRVRDDYL